MGPTAWRRIKEHWSRFSADTSGLTLIYVTIALPVIIGFALLAVDVGRLWSLQSSLQHGADALALAGGGELDRRPDAIVRSNRAIDNLITGNSSIFENATGVVTITGADVTRHFLDAIPASDADPIDATYLAAHETSDPIDARFVQVIVNPKNFSTIFPASFLGAANTTQSSAMAVAGMDQAVCNFTPLFMCNPFEPATGVVDVFADYGLYGHIKTVANRRRLIAFKAHDQSSQWSPGNYGFLEANAGPGANALGNSIASISPQACFIQNGLTTETGNMTDLMNAFNVRFDLYAGSYGNAQAKQSYPPAANVRKGYVVKKVTGGGQALACDDNNPIESFGTPAQYDQAMGLPRDSCFATGTCPLSGGRMGNGDWGGDTTGSNSVPDFEQYWQTNFGWDGIARPNDSSGQPYSNSNLPTRYDIYRYEIDNNRVSHLSLGLPGAQETGLPVCNANKGLSIPDRRIIYGAIINCRAAGVSGGKGGPYQAVAFGKFFMTEPMGAPPDSTLYTELIDVVEPGQADSVARDMVQLYR